MKGDSDRLVKGFPDIGLLIAAVRTVFVENVKKR